MLDKIPSVYGLERQRVETFEQKLESISFITTVESDLDFSHEFPVEEEINEFGSSIKETGMGLYLDPGVLAGTALGKHLSEERKIPHTSGSGLELAFSPLSSRGGKKSYHGVFFGDLNVMGMTLPAAIKPHITEPEKPKREIALKSCFGDYFKNLAIKRLGIMTLEPVGFMVDKNNTDLAYSMTLLEEGLTTMDSIDWSNFLKNPEANPGMLDFVRKISLQMALLHSSDSETRAIQDGTPVNRGNNKHGDAKARNLGNKIDGSALLLDWETAVIKGYEPKDAFERFMNSHSDIADLVWSMSFSVEDDGISMFEGTNLTASDWWENFSYIFFDDYKQARLVQAVADGPKLLADVREELKMLEATLRSFTAILVGIVRDEKLQKQRA